MKPNQLILGIIIFLGVLSFIGSMVLSGTNNYDVTPSDSFTETLTGNNYSEYKEKVEEIQVSAEDDGFLAQFKLGKAVYNVVTSSLGQVGALISNIADFVQLPTELVALIIVIIVISAIFGGLNYILK